MDDARLGTLIVASHRDGRGTYGSPRVFDELREAGERVSRKRVARLMKERNLVGEMKKRWRHPSSAPSDAVVAPNTLARAFNVPQPNRVWASDITYVRTHEGWLYGLTATEQLAKALDDISITDLGDVIIFGVSYLLIMAAFLIMAIQAFLAVLEYYVILAVAGILIPWALLPQTKFLAEKAIGAVVSAGIKLMVLAFIIAVVDPVLASIHFSGPEIKLNELWSVLLTAGAIAFLAWHVPSLAAGLLAGSPSLSAASVAQNVTSGP